MNLWGESFKTYFNSFLIVLKFISYTLMTLEMVLISEGVSRLHHIAPTAYNREKKVENSYFQKNYLKNLVVVSILFFQLTLAMFTRFLDCFSVVKVMQGNWRTYCWLCYLGVQLLHLYLICVAVFNMVSNLVSPLSLSIYMYIYKTLETLFHKNTYLLVQQVEEKLIS